MLHEVPFFFFYFSYLTIFIRHRADADYYPRLFSMILDQLEYVAEAGNGDTELFHIEFSDTQEIVQLSQAKEFVMEYWTKFAADGRDRNFKVLPLRY